MAGTGYKITVLPDDDTQEQLTLEATSFIVFCKVKNFQFMGASTCLNNENAEEEFELIEYAYKEMKRMLEDEILHGEGISKEWKEKAEKLLTDKWNW